MAKDIAIVHHPDRRTDVVIPYAPAIVVRRGRLVFVSGVTTHARCKLEINAIAVAEDA
jgi:hypothetical protein